MFKKITLSLCFCIVQFVHAQNPSCAVNPLTTQHYSEDIRSLAQEYMWQTQQDTTAVQIPQNHFNFVASKLSAVLELNTAETDSIFNKYCVHDVREIPELKQFIVFIDSTASWTSAWRNMQQVTGNTVIDSFMAAHNLTVVNYQQLPYDTSFGRHYVTIESPIVVNAKGLVNWFKVQSGILLAEQNITYGGAGRIFFYQDGSDSYITFVNEWDDCGDGCDNAIQWIYKINENCEAELFNRSEFHVWPTWPDALIFNCNIALNHIDFEKMQVMTVFPNPTDHISTLILNDVSYNETLKISNALGQIIKTIPINSTTIQIDLEDFPSGVYYLTTNRKSQTVKLLKR